MRDLHLKKNQSGKVKVIRSNNNEKIESPALFNLIIIFILFFTFLTLSIRNNNLFLTEILISGSVICLLFLQNPTLITKK